MRGFFLSLPGISSTGGTVLVGWALGYRYWTICLGTCSIDSFTTFDWWTICRRLTSNFFSLLGLMSWLRVLDYLFTGSSTFVLKFFCIPTGWRPALGVSLGSVFSESRVVFGNVSVGMLFTSFEGDSRCVSSIKILASLEMFWCLSYFIGSGASTEWWRWCSYCTLLTLLISFTSIDALSELSSVTNVRLSSDCLRLSSVASLGESGNYWDCFWSG